MPHFKDIYDQGDGDMALAALIIPQALKDKMRDTALAQGAPNEALEAMLERTTAAGMLNHFRDVKAEIYAKEEKTPEDRNKLNTMAMALTHAAGELNSSAILSRLGSFRTQGGAKPVR